MYYVCCKVGSKYGIIDTKDGKVEFYTSEQVEQITSQGIDIKGFYRESQGYSISVLEPTEFKSVSRDFVKTGYTFNRNERVGIKAKLAGIGYDFPTLFKDVKFYGSTGNIKYLELEVDSIDFNGKILYFSFVYDYSTFNNYCYLADLMNCIDNSIFHNHPRIFLLKNNNNNIVLCRNPFLGLRLSNNEFNYLIGLIHSFYNCKKDLTQYKTDNSEHNIMQDLYLKAERCETNIGNVPCVSVYTYLDIFRIPLVSRARIEHIYNEYASDSELYFKRIKPYLRKEGLIDEN